MSEFGRSDAGIEYRFLKFDTHNKAEAALNELAADGWQFVSYQASGESVITHFVVVSRAKERAGGRIGFGR
jgi:hypothetical protein